MQTLIRRHMVVIEDYDHIMNKMDENGKRMKLTYLYTIFILLFNTFFLNLRAHFCTTIFTT